MHKGFILSSITCLFFILFVLPCNAQKKKHKKKNKKEIVAIKKTNDTSTDCDKLYWKYVYNPSRLKVIDKCKTVTGVIVESSANEDGDHHMLIKLDEGQDELLTKKNKSKKEGNLVIEAVCANKVTLKKVANTCNGYINKIQIPKLGEHVRVSGSLVNDTHNGWNEIHPITKIEILK
ncbi:MAG TPA: hypothetical protein VMY77_02115 [Chitinophagaceae bacterium]|nr:hypothetical protein [Chitinophagaceae bacterium]